MDGDDEWRRASGHVQGVGLTNGFLAGGGPLVAGGERVNGAGGGRTLAGGGRGTDPDRPRLRRGVLEAMEELARRPPPGGY